MMFSLVVLRYLNIEDLKRQFHSFGAGASESVEDAVDVRRIEARIIGRLEGATWPAAFESNTLARWTQSAQSILYTYLYDKEHAYLQVLQYGKYLPGNKTSYVRSIYSMTMQ